MEISMATEIMKKTLLGIDIAEGWATSKKMSVSYVSKMVKEAGARQRGGGLLPTHFLGGSST